MTILVASTMRTCRHGGTMNEYEGRVLFKCGSLSEPPKGRRQTRLSVHSGRSVCKWAGTLLTSSCAERSSCNGILSRHPSRPTETNGFSREYERGMMLTPEFCQQSSSRVHAARGLTARCSAARCSYGPGGLIAGKTWLCLQIADAGHVGL